MSETTDPTAATEAPSDEHRALETAAATLHDAEPQAILEWFFRRYGEGVTLASAFGNTSDIVLMHMVSEVAPGTEVFYLDTDFLFPETYQLIDRTRDAYADRIALRMYRTDLTPAAQEAQYGAALWETDPDRCCDLRKVQPIHLALAGKRAWITGVRRDQSEARAATPAVQWDAKFGLAKANPLVNWSEQQAWQYIFANSLPYNALFDQNYPTVGCTHCTRAVLPGEDQRAGRWSGSAKVECGIHVA